MVIKVAQLTSNKALSQGYNDFATQVTYLVTHLMNEFTALKTHTTSNTKVRIRKKNICFSVACF